MALQPLQSPPDPTMRVIIQNDNILTLLAEANLLPAASINTLIQTLIASAFQLEEETCRIKVHVSLLANSYQSVPAMFGRTLARTVSEYPSVHSYRSPDSNYIVVYAGQFRQATTFKARVMRGLGLKGRISIKSDLVPATYRFNPKAMCSILEKELGKKVRAKRGPKATIEWWIK